MELDGVELGLYLAAAFFFGMAIYDVVVRKIVHKAPTAVWEPAPMLIIYKSPPFFVPLILASVAVGLIILGVRRRAERKRPLRFRPARRF